MTNTRELIDDPPKNYVCTKCPYLDEITPAAADIIDQQNREIDSLKDEIEALRNPWLEVWFPVFDGEIDIGAMVVTMINQMDEPMMSGILVDIEGYAEEAEINIPAETFGVKFKATKFSHHQGQMSFPETCQWDFPPHWEMDFNLIEFDIPPAPIKEEG